GRGGSWGRGVGGVVFSPGGAGGAGAGGLEDARPLETPRGRHVPAERPADDADAFEVQFRMLVAEELESLHLVFERDGSELLVDRPLPVAAATRGAAIVHGHDYESLIGDPLRNQPAPHRLVDLQVMRPA